MNKSRGGLSKREVRAQGLNQPAQKAAISSKLSKSSSSSSKLKKAEKSYLKTLKPSKEEDAALKTQSSLLQAEETEAIKIQNPQGDQGNTVAAPFVSGQLDALSAATQTKLVPLKSQIAALQSNREAKSGVAKAKYDTKYKSYSDKASTKATNPLDEEYKQLRNDRARQLLAKGGSSGGSGKTTWEKVSVQKDRRGNPVKALERNKQTGEYRTVNI